VYLPRGFDGGEGWSGFCGHFMASGAHVYTQGDPEYYYEPAEAGEAKVVTVEAVVGKVAKVAAEAEIARL
jgi:hypothetical protein